MKVIVIGSGLIGVTTAYFLRTYGHQVTVLDRREGPGRETSFANGALLTPSMSDPWNAPGCWRVLLASLARSDSPLQLRVRALPSLLRWGVTFLRNSSVTRFERNAIGNLRLALYSLEVHARLRNELGIEYGHAARGSMRIFRTSAALGQAGTAAVKLSEFNVRYRKLSARETVELNPALGPIEDQLAGSIRYESDETGDAHRFCIGLADRARQAGVEFRFLTEVTSLEMCSGRVDAVLTGTEQLVADSYVVAAGSYSASLLRQVGIPLPVRPAKGYSITLPQVPRLALNVPIVDDDFHAVVVPMQGAIRVAGTAEFAGFDLVCRPERLRNLLRLLQQVLPQERFDQTAAIPWCGLRPMSADGVPVIGVTPVSNLFVNTGHGHLGWTMAAGSARLLADLMAGKSPGIDPQPFALERFPGRSLLWRAHERA